MISNPNLIKWRDDECKRLCQMLTPEMLSPEAREVLGRINYLDTQLNGALTSTPSTTTLQIADSKKVKRSNAPAVPKRHFKVGDTKTTSGRFAGKSQRVIALEILKEAPDFTLKLDDIIARANDAGCELVRPSLRSIMSQAKEFKAVRPGSGLWTLTDPPALLFVGKPEDGHTDVGAIS